MATLRHLWAVGYDDMKRASEVRDEIARLGWARNSLILEDVAVAVRHPDGSFTLERESFPAASNVLGWSAVGFLAGLVLRVPLVVRRSARRSGAPAPPGSWPRPGSV